MQQQHSINDFSSSDSWVILSEIEMSIKRKIEAVGTPLKDWDIQIYRGVLTGYNEAFIISTEKRDEILANCQSEEERAKTAELIRPILRGRDIKRYGYDWANLWLIATFPARQYDIEQFPAVKHHLLTFAKDQLLEAGYDWVVDNYLADYCKQKLSQTGKFIEIQGKRITLGNSQEKARKKTSNKWFETQDSISYWDDFNQPKIVWAELARTGNAFVLDFSKHLVGNTGYILTVSTNNLDVLKWLLGFLNSRILLYCLNQITSRFDDNGWRWLRQFVENLRIPKFHTHKRFLDLINITNRNNESSNSELVNSLVADEFGLSEEEREYINQLLKGY